ncbi:MAG: thioredoxin family protein [Candidatus Izemoplasmatales bacterium]|nr:thioredoxin family protein [Candidatus Izemoplasmatales bacterium]
MTKTRLVKWFLIIMLASMLFACDQTTTTTDAGYDYDDFTSITVYDKYQQLNMADGTYYLYFFGTWCSHCESIKQTVLYTIDHLENDKVFLVSVTSTASILPGIDVTDTPSLVQVTDHEVVAIHVGTDPVLECLAGLS